MDTSRKHQVSLRGASAKEISRDQLLEKVSQERELRNYARRASAAALYIQRVWRRYYAEKKVAIRLEEEWEAVVKHHTGLITASWISSSILRPFLFFITCLSTRHRKIHDRDIDCMNKCFQILLESMNSNDSRKNFCSLAMGRLEDRRTWTYQAKKLISLCSFILGECDNSHPRGKSIIVLTSLALRLIIILTDLKGWKSMSDHSLQDAETAVKDLVFFMGSYESTFYISIRRYLHKLGVPLSSQVKCTASTDEFLLTASAVTLAVRPFHMTNHDAISIGQPYLHFAAEPFCLYLLTTPQLVQRIPTVLLPALKHKSILSPSFQVLLILKDRILKKMLETNECKTHPSTKMIPPIGWALANVISLASASENLSADSGGFNQDLDHTSYVQVVNTLSKALLDNIKWIGKDIQDLPSNIRTETSINVISPASEETPESLTVAYVDLLRPVWQRWHLVTLVAITKKNASSDGAESSAADNPESLRKLELLDIAYLYSYMLRIFAVYNPKVGSLPVLNLLSFTPGFLVSLWAALESYLFPDDSHFTKETYMSSSKSSVNRKVDFLEKKQKQVNKDGVNKWVNALHILTGKSEVNTNITDRADVGTGSQQVDEISSDAWSIEPLRRGPQGISKDMSCLLNLFCATYSHLLLVLDDIEFYEKQVPFTLEQQRRIASMLNTLVYNGLNLTMGCEDKSLMDSAIRCLHLLYERDCRHRFCPIDLWLSPARESRPQIAVAARTHEVLSSNIRSDDGLAVPSMGSIITTTPHVFPFDERVAMFREFISMDKVSRKMAGEVAGPGSRSIEIVVRRGHVVEDGFRQLNALGSRLKSSIHVSFVSESGLPEAGLDYGGLSKEFLTDLSKLAFSPEYGLFSQTSSSDRLLVPNSAAKYLENGMQMFEFLGRVVGKALYEGILLDYAFSHVFVQKLLGRYSFLDELSTLDPELYRNLMYVKQYDGDVTDLCLDFTVTEESFGTRHVIELKPGGKDISVTNENKLQYVHAVADYKLNRQILPFSNAFYRGLTDLISPSWLKLFNASEFNQLLSGGNHDIDVADLRNNTRYTGGYSEGSRTIKLFWEVVEGFEPKERCMLLKFVTSCSRAPLLGFKYLQPSFTIHKVACDSSLWAAFGGQDVERLPSASTCYNTLKLPTYKRATTLRAKLLYAISSNAGFELS